MVKPSWSKLFIFLIFKHFRQLLRRKKTIVGLLFPLFCGLALIWIISDKIEEAPGKDTTFSPLTVTGTSNDLIASTPHINLNPIKRLYCKTKMTFLYAAKQTIDERLLKNYMDNVVARYRNANVSISSQSVASKKILQEMLNQDYGRERFCLLSKYVGGVYFEAFDAANAALSYEFVILQHDAAKYKWFLDSEWREGGPFGPLKKDAIPRNPPYFHTGFLSYKKALDEEFIKVVKPNASDSLIKLQRFPVGAKQATSAKSIVSFIPVFAIMILLWPVTFLAGSIRSDCSNGMQEYLRVLGVSTPIFYLSFGFYVWCILAFCCGVILSPVILRLEGISFVVLLITVFIYSIAVTCFTLCCSTFFSMPTRVSLVTCVIWTFSMLLFTLQKDPTHINRHILLSVFSPNYGFFETISILSNYEKREVFFGLSQLFENSAYFFTVGYGWICMMANSCLYSVLTILFDCWRTSDEGLLTYVTRFFKKETNKSKQVARDLDTEVDFSRQVSKAGINIIDLKKIYRTGDLAVDGLNLKAAEAQVTVLLGVNGAGKSTTFQAICGMIQPTDGVIELAWNPVGLCLQENCFFEDITVVEHLQLISKIKDISRCYEDEANDILSMLKLVEQKNQIATTLSGGQKRKLSIAMALIGGSKIVLLDEPTAGIDVGARRDVEVLLESYKKDRTILMTTHFMDEAERIGDWIYIMVKGRAVTSGTPEFLKKSFGTGYILSLSVRQNSKSQDSTNNQTRQVAKHVKNQILDYFNNAIPANEAKLLNLKDDMGITINNPQGFQIQIVIPETLKLYFTGMLRLLERLVEEKNSPIECFGLSLNSLEQVFLTVGERADSSEKIQYTESTMASFLKKEARGNQCCWPVRFQQFKALLYKRFCYATSEKSETLFRLFFVPFLLAFMYIFALIDFSSLEHVENHRVINLPAILPVLTVLDVNTNREFEMAAVRQVLNSYNAPILDTPVNTSFNEFILKYPIRLPALGVGVRLRDTDSVGLFNYNHMHSIGSALDLLMNAKLRFESGYESSAIKTSLTTYTPQTKENGIEDNNDYAANISLKSLTLPIFFVFYWALITYHTSVYVTEEKSSQFATQQLLSPITPFLYWFTMALFDVLLLMVPAILMCLVLFIFELHFIVALYTFITMVIYIYAVSPLLFIIGVMFNNSVHTSKVAILIQIMAPIFSASVLALCKFYFSIPLEFIHLANVLTFFVPSFGLAFTLFKVFQHEQYINDMPIFLSYLDSECDVSNLSNWCVTGASYLIMLASGTTFLVLFLVCRNVTIQKYIYDAWNRIIHYERQREYTRVESSGIPDDKRNGIENELLLAESIDPKTCPLRIRNLTKHYSGKATPAVDNLTLVVNDAQQCFGLLGVNGAGKSTTFSIITGTAFPDNGSAEIYGHDTTAGHIPIGYCPQKDAFMMQLKGKDVLYIMASLHGYSKPEHIAEKMLEAVGMEKDGNRRLKNCSGGQKRKISVAAAMLAMTPTIIFDEPTASIDPKARREIWKHLIDIRDNSDSCLLLTSHSMEECEALCTKIGVLIHGQLKAVGTSQMLKSAYGNKYTISIVLRCANVPDLKEQDFRAKINAADLVVKQRFERAVLKTVGLSLTLYWQIPKEDVPQWSDVWSAAEIIKTELDAVDFTVTESSLEDTFSRLSADYENQSDYKQENNTKSKCFSCIA